MKNFFYSILLGSIFLFLIGSANGTELVPLSSGGINNLPAILQDNNVKLTEVSNDVQSESPVPTANKIKYVVVRDFDTYADSAYWLSLSGMQQYKDFAKFVNWNDLSNGLLNINDLQMVILPMGVQPLTKTHVTKLKDLIAKNKRILIAGHSILYYAFDDASGFKDAAVQDFLSNDLGIKYTRNTPLCRQEGNTLYYWSFTIHGDFADPIGKSIRKWCNIGFKQPDGTVWPPLVNVLFCNTFLSKDSSKYFWVEHFKRADDDPRTDTIVATRTTIGDSARVILYSIGFDAFAGEIPRSTLLERCIVWATEDIAPDGPQVQVDPLRMDFSFVPIGETRTADLLIKNVGNQPLKMEEIDFFDDAGAFTLTKGGFKSGSKIVTLKTGETYTVTVQFKPTQKQNYAGILTVKSNSVYYNFKDIDIVGVGGKDVSGPKIEATGNGTIDFGKIYSSSKDIELKIRNTGESELIIDKLKIIESDDAAFLFPQTINVPFSIAALDSNKNSIKVRFALRPTQKIYKGKIQIHSNATNSADYFIDLIGEVVADPGYVNDGKAETDDGSFKMSVTPNPGFEKSMLKYSLVSSDKDVSIKLYSVDGNEIVRIYSGNLSAGEYSFDFNMLNLPTGTYNVVSKVGEKRIVLPVIIVK